jgi:hypothetical protein
MQSARPLIVARILATVRDFRIVRGTSNYQAITRQSWPYPACFVLGAGEKPLRGAWNEQDGGVPSVMSDYYLVQIATQVEIDDDGTADDGSLLLGKKVVDALCRNWTPFGLQPLGYAGADVRQSLERNLLIRECFFSLTRYTEDN